MTAECQAAFTPALRGGAARGGAVLCLQAHGDFTQGIDSFGDSPNGEFQQRIRGLNDLVDGLISGIHRAGTNGSLNMQFAIGPHQTDGCRGHPNGSAGHLQAIEVVDLLGLVNFIGNQGFQIRIRDGLLFVSQILETGKRLG